MISQKIVEIVARDLRPISVVDGEGFKKLINYIEPGYKVPSHTHTSQLYALRSMKRDSCIT